MRLWQFLHVVHYYLNWQPCTKMGGKNDLFFGRPVKIIANDLKMCNFISLLNNKCHSISFAYKNIFGFNIHVMLKPNNIQAKKNIYTT